MLANYYKMYPEHHFAVVKLQAKILAIPELEQLNYKYKKDPDYSKIHYLLIEISKNSKLSFTRKDLKKLSDSYNTEFQENNHKVIVWVVAQPLITALTHLFVLQLNDNSKYCSTTSKAYDLLNMPLDFGKFEELVDTDE